MRADFRCERADFRFERADSRHVKAVLRPERVDLRPERADLRADLRPERADLRSETEFTFRLSVPPSRPEVADETQKRFWRQNEFPLCIFSRGGGEGGGRRRI